ncbi:MAG: L-glutamate gamma-semialdehyde dehydrogenase [Planctomycetia bacterium]|nr:MAG: L-glutamate gamma-semialdehyde dehydrogenase [Planctomycetia bacterium]
MRSVRGSFEQRVEQRAGELGREMFDRMRGRNPTILDPLWWEERMMTLCMADERFKLQAFRFIDALPTMTDAPDVARHVREYFAAPPERRSKSPLVELDPPRSRFIDWFSRFADFRNTSGLLATLTAHAARFASTRMAHRFIAGSTPQEAERTLLKMRRQKLAFTIDVLGEAAVSEAEALHYHGIYLDLITRLSRSARTWSGVAHVDEADGRPLPRVNCSVKLTSLFSQFDAIDPENTRRIVKERLRPLLREAMRHGTHLHVDMEHYAIKDLTLEICREVFLEDEFRDYPHVGVVLQAYLRDIDRDVEDMIAYARRRGTPVWVRLVKGAYWDTETVMADQQHWPCPVWRQKWESDAAYERVSRVLVENHEHIHTAFASHNVRSLAVAMALTELHGAPPAHHELQALYGMGDPIKRAAVEMGQRVRVYTPYGELLPGMAYLIRRLLENTANESFLRQTVSDDTPVDELLENPEWIGARTPPPRTAPLQRRELDQIIMNPFENVPNIDYTRPENRARLIEALASVRAGFGRSIPLVIGGQRVESGAWEDAVSPNRPSDKIARVAQADAALADRAALAAADAFGSWRRVPPHDRAEVLFEAARIIERRRFELTALETIENAKPWREADGDISEAIDFCNYYGREMIRLAENIRRRDVPGETNEYYYAPRGVVGVIAPWNFPLAILCGMTTAALVTGNTVVMKPAEQAMVIAARMQEILEQAGLPPGVLNYLPGPGHVVGDALVRHPRVNMIAFTGSRAVGCAIHRTAAQLLTAQPGVKRVIAELGGKNAVIVDSDADLDEAVRGVAHSAFGYAGQKCSACSRVIVLEAVYDKFLHRLVEAARSLSVGPADDPATFVPPVVDREAYEKIREYIEIGKREATCALETDTRRLREELGGWYIGPHIFAAVPPDARIAQEEIFGPVLAVIKARDFDDAIEIFNGTDYALTGGIFSRSPANIARAREECECGNFYINRRITGALVDLHPFGGFKMSGMGSKAGGPDYLLQFCEPRAITENTLRRGFAPSPELAHSLA